MLKRVLRKNLEPSSPGQQYLDALRIRMEAQYGVHLRSTKIKNITFVDPKDKNTYFVTICRFTQQFPHNIPIADPSYIDLFLNPVNKRPYLLARGLDVGAVELTPQIPIQALDNIFATLVWGSEKTEEGISLPLIKIHIQ